MNHANRQLAWIACMTLAMATADWVNAQSASTKLKVGEPIPTFELKGLEFYDKKEISSSELKGRHIILDFWTVRCPACIQSMPHIDAIAKKYSKALNVFLIGQDDVAKKGDTYARKAFDKYKAKWNLTVPVAFDADLFELFEVKMLPYCVWVDPAGIIKGLTLTTDVTEENVEAFLGGSQIKSSYTTPGDGPIKLFDYNKPLLINSNGGEDMQFLYRSVLSKWIPDTGGYLQPYISSVDSSWAGVKKNQVQENGVSLLQLIEIAYGDTIEHRPPWYSFANPETEKVTSRSSYERVWRFPILEVQDTTPFVPNWKTGENVFSYSLIIPEEKGTAMALRTAMQKDLSTYFNYQVTIESRSMPCWFLTASARASANLRSKGTAKKLSYTPTGIRLASVPLYQLTRLILAYNPGIDPIIDQSQIKGFVDLSLDAAMMDFNDVKTALEKKEIYLTKGVKSMQVIVVRDSHHP